MTRRRATADRDGTVRTAADGGAERPRRSRLPLLVLVAVVAASAVLGVAVDVHRWSPHQPALPTTATVPAEEIPAEEAPAHGNTDDCGYFPAPLVPGTDNPAAAAVDC